MKSRSGFTLVEVMITIVILFVVIDSMMLFFLNVMAEYRRQSKITETGIETVIGLEVLRKDVESAGYALPWISLPAYDEAASGVPTVSLNDTSPNAPRAVVNGVGMGFDNSDILVIKSVSVGTDEACRRWTTLREGDIKRLWSDNSLNFSAANQVLVLGTDTAPTVQRRYVAMTAYNNTSGFAPSSPEVRLIHGLTDSITPRMPFNRAEYFIETDNVPRLCAPNTGVLVKSVIRQDTGNRGPSLPLLDCVRDVQVAFGLNTLGTDPAVDCVVATPIDNTAAYLRTHLRDIRISILTHEGAADRQYQHPNASIFVGDDTFGPVGRAVDVSAALNYRWKLHNIVVRPSSLR